MEKFSDLQKKKIVADYIECRNYSKVAREYDTSHTTVRKIVKADHEVMEKLMDKKNTMDILQFMDNKKDKVCNIIDMFLDDLSNKEKIGNTGLPQVASSLGVIIEKFTKKGGSEGTNGQIEQLIKGLKRGE